MGYHKVAPFYYTSWDKPASQTQFLINKIAFEKLPNQYQNNFKKCNKSCFIRFIL